MMMMMIHVCAVSVVTGTATRQQKITHTKGLATRKNTLTGTNQKTKKKPAAHATLCQPFRIHERR
jgi:hypothetical protein